ncbi:alpha/beta hydrolase [Phaeovibrio sulfidiphilus]|uniref:Palmitoyl-protein thioesterase ABHD10, mitochondrial n=1 Tax=Phaeovibrio sulfidiphilus TaxID=1220600 RepID=A0A8J6YMQ3_9PROT|nr:alpha/beta hydrolase [Phaeovibrio sulfidiphilus]MBE1237435.1 alpha/beta hydrolase [Phaeovibrio sulfidiphilus]
MTDDSRPTPHRILTTPEGASLACRLTPGKSPAVVYLHGLQSDMGGGKARALEDWARRTGRACVMFDQQGHGQSSGLFSEGSIGQWARDTVFVLRTLTSGNNIVVGSSMGGWIMMLTALMAPEQVGALVGIAAAPDFTTAMTRDNPLHAPFLDAEGNYTGPSSGDPDFPPLMLRRAFLEDGNAHAVLTRTPAEINVPVRLLHGLEDETVPWQVALKIQSTVRSPDVVVTLVKDAGHRMNRDSDMALLLREIESLARDLDAPHA